MYNIFKRLKLQCKQYCISSLYPLFFSAVLHVISAYIFIHSVIRARNEKGYKNNINCK